MLREFVTRGFWSIEVIAMTLGALVGVAGAVLLFVVADLADEERDAAIARAAAIGDQLRAAELVDYQYSALQAQSQVLALAFQAVTDPAERRRQRLEFLYQRAMPVTRMIAYAYDADEGARVLAAYQKEFDAYERGDDGALSRINGMETAIAQQALAARQGLIGAQRAAAAAARSEEANRAFLRDLGGALLAAALFIILLGLLFRRAAYPDYPPG